MLYPIRDCYAPGDGAREESVMAAETYGLELNTLLSVGELQCKEGPVVTHVVNFIPPTQPIKTHWPVERERERERERRKK